MHTKAEEKLKAASRDSYGWRRPPADSYGWSRPPSRPGAQIQPRPIRYHMWLSQLSYGMTWPARTE
jgi:hypothetical protein